MRSFEVIIGIIQMVLKRELLIYNIGLKRSWLCYWLSEQAKISYTRNKSVYMYTSIVIAESSKRKLSLIKSINLNVNFLQQILSTRKVFALGFDFVG